MKVKSLRISDSMEKEVERVAKEKDRDFSYMARQFIFWGLDRIKKERIKCKKK
jgi:predicted transcriptional regulator